MTTSAPEVKARIIALLQAASALDGVDVQPKGPVQADAVTPEMVYLGRVRGDQDWASLGAYRREEEYTIDLFIRNWAAENGTTELEIDTRCWAIFTAIGEAIHVDPALDQLLQGGNIQVKTFEQDSQPTLEPLGFRGWLDAQLLVTAQIRRP